MLLNQIKRGDSVKETNRSNIKKYILDNKPTPDELIDIYKLNIWKIARSILKGRRHIGILDADDLFQYGVIGLLEAFKKHNWKTYGIFYKYAKKFIIGKMIRSIHNFSSTIRVPVYIWDDKKIDDYRINTISSDVPSNNDSNILLIETVGSLDFNFKLMELKEDFKRINPLLVDCYFKGMTGKQMAKKYNWAYDKLNTLKNDFVKDLRISEYNTLIDLIQYKKYLVN